MPRRPDLKCNLCGELKWRGTTSLPEGKYRCQPCRRISPQPTKPPKPHKRRGRDALCLDCGRAFWSVPGGTGWTQCCSRRCAQRRRARLNPLGSGARGGRPKSPYYQRADNAPGLTTLGRKRLLDKWRARGRTCTYCDGPCETVDHVIPLKLGGTNLEGNLVPCCRPCNGSKSSHLLAVWRYRIGGRRGKSVRGDHRLGEVRRATDRAA